MTAVIRIVSRWAIPFFVLAITAWGMKQKVPIYESFVEGAKEGWQTALRLCPTWRGCWWQSKSSVIRAPWTCLPVFFPPPNRLAGFSQGNTTPPGAAAPHLRFGLFSPANTGTPGLWPRFFSGQIGRNAHGQHRDQPVCAHCVRRFHRAEEHPAYFSHLFDRGSGRLRGGALCGLILFRINPTLRDILIMNSCQRKERAMEKLTRKEKEK